MKSFMATGADLYEKRAARKKTLLIALLLLAALLFFLGLRALWLRRSNRELSRSFRDHLFNGRYAEAMEVYHRTQDRATDLAAAEAERRSFRSIQEKLEAEVSELLHPLLDRLYSGLPLQEADLALIEGVRELSTPRLIAEINELSKKLLESNLDAAGWEHALTEFGRTSNLRHYASDLLAEKEGLLEMQQRVREAEAKEGSENWQDTWLSWQELVEDEKAPFFARDYAGLRLKDFQEREYSRLMDESGRLIEAGRYYSARQLLLRLQEVFPDRHELEERIGLCEGHLPASVENWKDLIPVLALRPLAVRPELSFARAGDKTYARNSLISAAEFLEILQDLYRRDYVLVSPRSFADYPKRSPSLMVPTGKKPLILLFDRWQYTVLNQICGTAGKLKLGEDGSLRAEAGDEEGRQFDAITILEDFLAAHPDFSFDGGKAVIALNAYESNFGCVCDEKELAASREAWLRVGQEYPRLKADELALQKAEADRVLDYLLEKGWDFASAGYQGLESGNIAWADFEREVYDWQAFYGDKLGKPAFFAFPSGSHVYGDEEKLLTLLKQGYNVFFGEGPKPYVFYGNSYVHFDRQALNANSFAYAGPEFREILNGENFLDTALRKEEP